METPCIKGTAFQSAHDDVHRLLAEGRLHRDAIEARLAADDLRILDQKISPATWYPMASYVRLVMLLAEQEARGSEEAYLIERGSKAAERLAASGIYSQLDASTERLGNRIGRMIATIGGAIYNFTEWRYEPRPRGPGFTATVQARAEFPDVARFTSQGFIETVATRASGIPMRVVSERASPLRVIFRGMARDPAPKSPSDDAPAA